MGFNSSQKSKFSVVRGASVGAVCTPYPQLCLLQCHEILRPDEAKPNPYALANGP
jgi:hypothetical protein